ncbi:MAG: hypothetical protein M3R24_25280 [Chloroflexota bacterium]|nr:hypothetical protein [Chloroflexota bacterium]PLS80091.1 MAG: hypothetical protein CYG59_09825 [Chloroflexota bacterium]
MIICLNGIDGSGKSSQAQRLIAQLNAAGYPAVHVWTGGRRSLRRPLISLGKRLLKTAHSAKPKSGKADPAATQSGYGAYISTTQRILKRRSLYRVWQHLSLLEHAAEIWVMVLPHLLRGRIVVCDRYLHDSIIRVAVLAGNDASQLPQQLRLLRWYRVPAPTLGFLIDVPSEVAFSRKDDIPDIEYLRRRVPFYRAAAAQLKMLVVDGTKTPDEIASHIWETVTEILPEASKPLYSHR